MEPRRGDMIVRPIRPCAKQTP